MCIHELHERYRLVGLDIHARNSEYPLEVRVAANDGAYQRFPKHDILPEKCWKCGKTVTSWTVFVCCKESHFGEWCFLPIGHAAPTFPAQAVLPNRAEVVQAFKRRGLMPRQPGDLIFDDAKLGQDWLTAGLSAHQRLVDEAKVSLGMTTAPPERSEGLSALRARQEEEDFKLAQRLQGEERGDIKAGADAMPACVDRIKRDTPPRNLFTMNRSTGGRRPRKAAGPRGHKRLKGQHESKYHAVRQMMTGAQPKAEQPDAVLDRPGVLCFHRDMDSMGAFSESDDDSSAERDREYVPQTSTWDIIIPAHGPIDLENNAELFEAIHAGSIVGPMCWEPYAAKWQDFQAEFTIVDASQTLVIVRQSWAALCPGFGRNVYLNDVNAPATRDKRANALKMAKAAWKNAMSRPYVRNRVWFLMYCSDGSVANAWHLQLQPGRKLTLADHPDVMYDFRRGMKAAPPGDAEDAVLIWNNDSTDWDDKTVSSAIAVSEGVRTVIARLDHVVGLVHLGVEIHALTADDDEPPWDIPTQTPAGSVVGSRAPTRASSVRSARASMQPTSSQTSYAASQSSSRPRSPSTSAIPGPSSIKTSRMSRQPSSSQSSYLPSTGGGSSQMSSRPRSPSAPAPPVARSSSAMGPSASQDAAPPQALSARAAGKKRAQREDSPLEIWDGTPFGKKVKRERDSSPVVKREWLTAAKEEEVIDVDAWVAAQDAAKA
ncbi:hypothetical protein K466DRAFT_601378 [Polyporus arcularius HHB13444]|uniref:Uncharacterized protein n=1 Tax=Polyporus arcularius HHB13444 TaxID=1314778 RepID=A0A5C3P6S8_9APHY|nr:hypothetical protein K466DRAFT_601378 [Polyporus arcularius HHB13444]